MNRREALILGLTSMAATFAPHPLFAKSSYPDRPIRLIVPRPAGGVVDVISRQWADGVKDRLGTVVVENQGGGGGTIGTAAVARAAPDGYTLVMGSTSDLVLNPLIMPQLSYDPTRDFAPVSIMAISVAAIVVNASLPVHTLKELVAYAKANPGKLSYGSAGGGTMANLAGEQFKRLAGLPDIVHVPYKGAAPGLADLVAGHIPMMAANVSDSAIELHKAGKVRILAAASEQRVAAAPDVPTAAEAGYPDLIAQLFMGLFAPAGTPRPIIEQIAQATRGIMADQTFREKLITAGFEPIDQSDPETATRYLKEELVRWTPVLKASGLKTN